MRYLAASDGQRTALRSLLALVLTLLLGLLILAGQPATIAGAAEPAVANKVRIGGDMKRTRFVADLDREVGFSAYALAEPYRVVIDMADVRFALPEDAGRKVRGLISAYRYGEVATGRARIVIETSGPALIDRSYVLPPAEGQPARLVVDLVPANEDEFDAALVASESANREAIRLAAEAAATETPTIEENVATAPESESPETMVPAGEKPRRHDGRRLIVIDPGHGGIDPGAIGVKRTREKDVVLAFGLALRDVLMKTGQYEVVMTRDSDAFLTLKQRVRVARENAADLFIAIHADTVRGPAARGATIYTLSEKASDQEAEALAQKENRADIIGGIDLGQESEEVTDILIDLVQRESKNHSLFFAKKAVTELRQVTAFTGKPMRSAGFVVLKAPDVPSVLVELGYLSSRQDEAQLTSAKWRAKVADAMARAIGKYFETEVAARAE